MNHKQGPKIIAKLKELRQVSNQCEQCVISDEPKSYSKEHWASHTADALSGVSNMKRASTISRCSENEGKYFLSFT